MSGMYLFNENEIGKPCLEVICVGNKIRRCHDLQVSTVLMNKQPMLNTLQENIKKPSHGTTLHMKINA